MMENPIVREFRDALAGKDTWLDSWHFREIHGMRAVATFEREWGRWRAREKRRAVVYGHADNRRGTGVGKRGTVGPNDMEEALLHFRYAFGRGWQCPEKTRLMHVGAWLERDATPAQRAFFVTLGNDPQALDPVRSPLADLLVFFFAFVNREKRLPTREELRAACSATRKTVLSAAERQAFRRNLKALGLDGLPLRAPAGPPPDPPEYDERDPFDVLTGEA